MQREAVGEVSQPTRGKAAVNQSRSPTLPLASHWEEKQSSQNNGVILASYV